MNVESGKKPEIVGVDAPPSGSPPGWSALGGYFLVGHNKHTVRRRGAEREPLTPLPTPTAAARSGETAQVPGDAECPEAAPCAVCAERGLALDRAAGPHPDRREGNETAVRFVFSQNRRCGA